MRHSEHVAEQKAQKIDGGTFQQGNRDDAQRKRGVMHEAENGIEREQFLPSKTDQDQRRRNGRQNDRERQVDLEREPECNPEQACLR
mgnify:CR=1 FL=1